MSDEAKKEKPLAEAEYKELLAMLVDLMMKPVEVMVEVGAFPAVMLAQQQSGNLVIMPMSGEPKEKLARLLREAADSIENGQPIDQATDLLDPKVAACPCPACETSRRDLEALQAMNRGAASVMAGPGAPVRVVAPAKRGVH